MPGTASTNIPATTSNGAPSATFTYDANGNLKSDGSTSFVYDAENRLVSASGAKTASLAYDPLGRLWQVSGGTAGTTRFVYDGDRLVEEYDGAGTAPSGLCARPGRRRASGLVRAHRRPDPPVPPCRPPGLDRRRRRR